MNWYLFVFLITAELRVTTVLPILEVLKRYLKDDPRCLELFGRNLWPNWTSWGNEVCTSWQVKQLFIFFFLNKEVDCLHMPINSLAHCGLPHDTFTLTLQLILCSRVIVYDLDVQSLYILICVIKYGLNWIESFMLHVHTKKKIKLHVKICATTSISCILKEDIIL